MFAPDLKRQLRSLFLNKKIINKSLKDQLIYEKLINFEPFKKAKSIFMYLSLPHEVDTSMVLKTAFDAEKKVLVPVITNNQMNLHEIRPETQFELGVFNIRCPINTSSIEFVPDLTIVPMLAYHKLERLGMGGGYYDKWLPTRNTYKLGLCYSDRFSEKPLALKHDVNMDTVITDKEIIK